MINDEWERKWNSSFFLAIVNEIENKIPSSMYANWDSQPYYRKMIFLLYRVSVTR